MRSRFALALLPLLFIPLTAHARPFGGQASEVHFCYNQTIYIRLGPPVGGVFLWTKSTDSRMFGIPSAAGQWLLGLAGMPSSCLYTIVPIDIRSAETILLHGRSQ